jgi:hypothetical protein
LEGYCSKLNSKYKEKLHTTKIMIAGALLLCWAVNAARSDTLQSREMLLLPCLVLYCWAPQHMTMLPS